MWRHPATKPLLAALLAVPFIWLLLAFTTTAVVIAQLFVAAPLYVRATVVALNAIDDDIGHAATIDGADTWQQWRYITIPLAWPGIQAGMA
ncbi:MAG: ABC transporter permease subunit, partial [Betaproteobacteria bacterium]|nr:ABC transporter permease subunit [Betaproteobacteria bacterium]